MTLPQNVADAVRYGDECWDDGSDPDEREMWRAIRAHLMSQEAEIERLRQGIMKHEGEDARERDAALMLAAAVHQSGGRIAISAMTLNSAPRLILTRVDRPDLGAGTIEFHTSYAKAAEAT